MSISAAQLIPQAGSGESASPSGPSTRIAASPAATTADSPAPSPTPTPAVVATTAVKTNMQFDSRHQVYYEYVDDSTGDVVFEIPPEALRKIGESLNLPLIGDASITSIDVKS